MAAASTRARAIAGAAVAGVDRHREPGQQQEHARDRAAERGRDRQHEGQPAVPFVAPPARPGRAPVPSAKASRPIARLTTVPAANSSDAAPAREPTTSGTVRTSRSKHTAAITALAAPTKPGPATAPEGRQEDAVAGRRVPAVPGRAPDREARPPEQLDAEQQVGHVGPPPARTGGHRSQGPGDEGRSQRCRLQGGWERQHRSSLHRPGRPVNQRPGPEARPGRTGTPVPCARDARRRSIGRGVGREARQWHEGRKVPTTLPAGRRGHGRGSRPPSRSS